MQEHVSMSAQLLQSYLTLCDPTDYSPPGSSVYSILQAKILEWAAMPSCRGSSPPRDQTCVSCVSCIAGRFFTHWATWEARNAGNPGPVPGPERFPGEGNSYPLQYSSEKPMEPHSSTLAWKIPWMEEPGRLQSMGSLRVGHDWATSLSLFTFHVLEKEMATHSCVLAWRMPGTGEPGGLPSMGSHRVGHDWSDLAAAAQYSCLENSLDRRGWWVTIHRVTKSPTEWLTLSLRFNYLQLNYNQIKSPLSWNNSTPLIINRPRLEWDWDPCLPQ